MTPHLRPARPEDALACGTILSAANACFEWLPKVHSGAEDIAHCGQMIERGWVTVALHGNRPCAFIARDESVIHAVYVEVAAQRQGIGQALLHAAMRARARLELWTFEANVAAQRFYLRAGFAEVERTDGAGNDEGLPDIRFVWERKR